MSFLYRLRERAEDLITGKVDLSQKRPNRFAAEGAYRVESSDYRWLDRIFSAYPLKEGAVLMDVGCGEGRVLSYLARRNKSARIIGVELDPQAAETARQRCEKLKNVEIIRGNILEKPELISEATAFYLFNPFNRKIFTAFVELLERLCRRSVTLYYANDLHRSVLDKREGWTILRREMLSFPNSPRRPYTVYRYKPKKALRCKVRMRTI